MKYVLTALVIFAGVIVAAAIWFDNYIGPICFIGGC
jgi:lipopolysaccharide export LptBFGC system permease protein LptF